MVRNIQLEKVRAELDVISDKKKHLFYETKDAIISLFVAIDNWLMNDLNVNLYNYSLKSLPNIDETLAKIQDSYRTASSARGKVQLLVDDEDLVKAGNAVLIETLKVHQYVERSLKELRIVLNSESKNLENLTNAQQNWSSLPEDLSSSMLQRSKDLEIESEQIRDKFHDEKQQLLRTAINFRNKFRELAKNFLKKP